MLDRPRHLQRLRGLLDRHPVVGILGARQVGKTTLARSLATDFDGPTTFFDLEDPDDLARLAEPKLALKALRGLVVLDEIQYQPELFRILRVLADRPGKPATFLVLGSASPDLLKQSSESLAGRIHYHQLDGFALDEVGFDDWQSLWLRGGFPRSYLADSDAFSAEWRRGFVRTFLGRDLPALGIRIESESLRRFWTMIAHYHGQTWNGAELARAFGVSASTVRRYLDLLTSALVVRQLQPWHENLSKRQVRAPKVYLADCGLLHTLLDLETHHELSGHPKVGASFEGFALQEVITHLGARPETCYFWGTHAGAELDLLIARGQLRRGFEFKHSSAPRTTRSMHQAVQDLQLNRLDVIHAGEASFRMADKIFATGISKLQELPELGA